MNKLGSSDTKLLILIFCLGFILRLFFALNSQEPIIRDGVLYDSISVSLINGKGFSLDGEHPTSQVPPFYPYFLASIYAIFGHNLKVALIIQALIGTIACFFIYKLAWEVFKDRNIAVCSMFISAVYYYFIREGERLWTEPIFVFLIILLVFCYVKLASSHNIFYAVTFGLSSAALVLTRPLALFLPFGFMIIELFRTRYMARKNIFSHTIRYISVALLIFVIPLALWAIRNFVIQKDYVLVATGAGRNFYEAFNPFEGKKYGITVIDETIKKGEVISSEAARDRFYFREGIKSIFNKSRSELLRLTLLKGLTFWSLIDWGPMGNGKAVFNFCTSFILPFSIAAILLLRRNNLALICLLMPIGYFFFFSLVFMGLPRFRLPIEPFLLILASYGIVRLFNKFHRKIVPALVIFIWLGFNILLFMNSDYVKEFFRQIAEAGNLW